MSGGNDSLFLMAFRATKYALSDVHMLPVQLSSEQIAAFGAALFYSTKRSDADDIRKGIAAALADPRPYAVGMSPATATAEQAG